MAATDTQFQRAAVITKLIAEADSSFGRTALMKCMYFLQTLKGVPLDYEFRLYTYGPFDPDVLNDLSVAEKLHAVESQLLQFPGGYGYELQLGRTADALLRRAGDFLSRYDDAIEWVAQEFAGRSAVDLETASTLVYVDRSVADLGRKISLPELARKVHEVKPHLDIRAIESEARKLKEEGIIAVTA